jgi:Fe-S cluster assembly ATP-binding protein
MNEILRIEDLRVSVEDDEILHGVNLIVKEGETHLLFGPNGSGKTTLLSTIMGFSKYRITEGEILFKGQDISEIPICERAKMGLGMSFQRPPTIRGVSTRRLAEICSSGKTDIDELAAEMNLVPHLDRDINLGFSGGEIKRAELYQLLAQQPDLVLLDEPESGVDLENMSLIGESTRRLLGKDRPYRERKDEFNRSALIITHTGHILDYIAADVGHVMCSGVMGCSGNPWDILSEIRRMGYEECIRCQIVN